MKVTAECDNRTEDIAAEVSRLRRQLGDEGVSHIGWRFRDFGDGRVQVVATAGKDPMRNTEGSTHPPGED